MKKPFVLTYRPNLNDYDYHKLDAQKTEQFVESICELLDSVIKTNNEDFINWYFDNRGNDNFDVYEMFKDFFAVLNNPDLVFTVKQRNFISFCQINVMTIFKWYRKNNRTVNVSPKQLDWFSRWFAKQNIDFLFFKTSTFEDRGQS